MFHQYRYGFSHVICDADGRIIASSIMKGDGPVMASAPMLLHVLARIASGEGPAPELATRALEECGEREAIILDASNRRSAIYKRRRLCVSR